MSLAKKLNLEDGAAPHVVGTPSAVDLDDVQTSSSRKGAVLLFAKNKADLDARVQDVWSAQRFRPATS